MPLGSKLTPPRGSQFYIELYKKKFKRHRSSLEPLMVIWPNSTEMVPRWSPTKIVQMILIGCICRSRGQKIGFQNAIFKNLVWNYKAQSFRIWYIKTSSRSSLPIFGYINIMASPWPLTFSSGERPRALWALLFLIYILSSMCLFSDTSYFTTSRSWSMNERSCDMIMWFSCPISISYRFLFFLLNGATAGN